MVTAINTAATSKFVVSQDKNKEGVPAPDATYWELGAMDSYIQAHISSKSTSYSLNKDASMEDLTEENASQNVKIDVDFQGMIIEACRLCLRGWSNFKDHLGNDIPFKTKKTNIKGRLYDAVDPDLLARISKDVLTELYAEINRISDLTEEEVKN